MANANAYNLRSGRPAVATYSTSAAGTPESSRALGSAIESSPIGLAVVSGLTSHLDTRMEEDRQTSGASLRAPPSVVSVAHFAPAAVRKKKFNN